MSFPRSSSVLLAALVLGLSGCARLAPGLNIEPGPPGVYPLTPQPQAVAAPPAGEWAPGTIKIDETAAPAAAINTGAAAPLQASSTVQPTALTVPATQAAYTVVEATPQVVARLIADAGRRDVNMASALSSVSVLETPPAYRIGPLDLVYILVWEHPELTQVSVSPREDEVVQPRATHVQDGRPVAADGSLYFPYVGKVHAAGMTADELRSYLTEHLRSAIREPKVEVRVVGYRARRVQVAGEVLTPGVVTLDDTPMGLLQAIARTGGLTQNASRLTCLLRRGGVTYPIDMNSLYYGGGAAVNPRLQAGDEIFVPSAAADKVYVMGEVAQQQPFVMHQHGVPLIEALAQAGGLSQLNANDAGVLVFRAASLVDDGSKQASTASVYVIDLSKTAGMLLASQFPLEPRDVVYVKATAFAQYNRVIGEIAPTVSLLLNAARIPASINLATRPFPQ